MLIGRERIGYSYISDVTISLATTLRNFGGKSASSNRIKCAVCPYEDGK